MRVLIIDDEESIGKTTSILLSGIGHEAVCATNSAAALRELDKAPFEVVFLDLKLGAENGLALLPELIESNPQMDVVVCTAYASIETAVEAMRLGAADYLPKPFTPEQVRQVCARLTDAQAGRPRGGPRIAPFNRCAHGRPDDRRAGDGKSVQPGVQAAVTPVTVMIR
jgi:NtrC-family two-component system response regulator AlgB